MFFGKCRSVDKGENYFLEFFTNFNLPERIDPSIVEILNKRFQNKTRQEVKIDSKTVVNKLDLSLIR